MQETNPSSKPEPFNPFPGLRPFDPDETHLFFGRDGQSEELLKRLKRTRFLAVVGTSGSGKSSLVRAGLLPALQGGLMAGAGSGWRIALFRPSNDPIGNLAGALMAQDVFGSGNEKIALIQTAMAETTLRRGSLGLAELVRQASRTLDKDGQPRLAEHENLLIVVDQFEELYRYKKLSEDGRAGEETAAFVKLLLEAVRQKEEKIYVVLTMRSDFLGESSQFWGLPEAINNGQYLIPRMTRDERRQAITGPVAVGHGHITDPLVNQLLNDVGDNPDQLPILQHAMMCTWDYWMRHTDGKDGDAIDLPHYQAIGGMAEALSRHADEAYNELPDYQQNIAEKLFKALTEKGTDNREIRHPMELKQICEVVQSEEQDVIAVIESFRQKGRSFLMPSAGQPLHAESLIDISHESLIRGWTRLKAWVDEEAESARVYGRLAETATLYKDKKEDLYRDPALQLALDWREINRPNRAWACRYDPDFDNAIAFLEASQANHEAEIAEAERHQKEQAERERRELENAQALAEQKQRTAEIERQRAEEQAAAARQRAAEQQRRAEVEARNAKRLRLLAVALGVVLLLAMVAALFAWRQGQKANEARNEAEGQKFIAEQKEKDASLAREDAVKQKDLFKQQKELATQKSEELEVANRVKEEQRRRAIQQQEIAERAEKKARHLLYAANINFVQRAYEYGDLAQGLELLDANLPKSKQDDLRGYEWYYLWRLYHQRTLRGHTGFVSTVAFSPDGKTLATGSGDKTVKLWDATSRQELATLKGHTAQVGAVAFSPDGKTLATGSADQTVKLWDPTSRQELATLKGHTAQVLAVAFSPDGKTLATGSGDKTVKLWDPTSRQELATLKGHTDGVAAVAFSPDGKTLATGSYDRTVKLWDPTSRQELATLKGHTDGVAAVVFSPDGKTLATGSADQTVKLWDPTSRQELATLKGHTGEVYAVAFSPDGKTLATGSGDDTVKLWDPTSRQELATLKGHTGEVYAVAFSPDGKTLATGSGDKTVKLWDPTSRQELATLKGHTDGVAAVAFSPDGKTLATGSYDRTVKLWDPTSRQELATLKGHTDGVAAVVFSPDGKTLATGTYDTTVKLWDPTARQELATLKGHTGAVHAVAFSPDGKTLATGSSDKTVKLWDPTSRQELATLKGQTGEVYAVAFSPDGKTLATGSGDDTVKLWDPTSRQELATLKGHTGTVYGVAFSPDGKTLATGSFDMSAKLWDTTSRQELVTLKGHPYAVTVVAFSSDGKTLATGSFDKSVGLWYAATDQQVIAQTGH